MSSEDNGTDVDILMDTSAVVFGQPIMTSLAPAASTLPHAEAITEAAELDGIDIRRVDASIDAAWQAQRDANLAVEQVDLLEIKVDELHMRVLALTHALDRIKRLGAKNLPAPAMAARVNQICAEVAV